MPRLTQAYERGGLIRDASICQAEVTPGLVSDIQASLDRFKQRTTSISLLRGPSFPKYEALWKALPWSNVYCRRIIDAFIHHHAKRQLAPCQELIMSMLDLESVYNTTVGKPNENPNRTLFYCVVLLMLSSIPFTPVKRTIAGPGTRNEHRLSQEAKALFPELNSNPIYTREYASTGGNRNVSLKTKFTKQQDVLSFVTSVLTKLEENHGGSV